MPAAAQRALRAIAVPARADIVRYLLLHPESVAREVTAGTGIGRDTVRASLLELERAGFLFTDAEGDRERRTVRYSIDAQSLRDALSELSAYVMGDDRGRG